jgi:hypothetical protein
MASRNTGRWINTPHCNHLTVPYNTNRKSPEPSEHQILQFHVIPRLVITGVLTTAFNQDFNNRHRYCVTFTQVQWSVFDFMVIPSLVITSILTTISNQDFNIRRRQNTQVQRSISFELLRKAWRWRQYEPKRVADVLCSYQYLTCCVWQFTLVKHFLKPWWRSKKNLKALGKMWRSHEMY